MNHPICLTCQKASKPVKILTLKVMLAVVLTELRDVEYRFCPTPNCSTIYFSSDNLQRFDQTQLR